MIPWLRLQPSEVLAMAERPQEQAPDWVAIDLVFPSPACWETFRIAVSPLCELAALRAGLAADSIANREILQRIDALTLLQWLLARCLGADSPPGRHRARFASHVRRDGLHLPLR